MKNPEVALSDIEFGDRFREDYGNVEQLAFDIQKNGLINPIAIGMVDKVDMELDTTCPYVLLAGGRRYTAMKTLGWTHVPVRIYDQVLSELDLRSIELAENFQRKDLDYAEDVALKKEINDLQTSIHGIKISRDPDAPGWSKRDTADLLGKSPATIVNDIKLAEAIEKFPEMQLDQCKNKAEAMKRLKNVGKMIVNSQNAATYTESMQDNKAFNKLSSSYIIGDCFKVMAKIPDSSLDMVEIDPPYGIDLTNVKKDNDCIGYNEVPADAYKDFMTKTLSEAYRIMKEGSWLVLWFAADPWFDTIATIAEDVGFKMNRIPGIWAKAQGQTAQPETYLGNSYEMFFYARKGKARLHSPGRSNIFQFPAIPPAKKYHPTQRPLDMMVDILNTFAAPGANIFVPFLGSGVTILAGHECKMNVMGSDLTEQFKEGFICKLEETLKS